ncbi:MAG: hypothetical protein JEZ07_00670 [Phycisphaerae bacterium]|nr:hypothetical protein [Phycisphaerae bacterium]
MNILILIDYDDTDDDELQIAENFSAFDPELGHDLSDNFDNDQYMED